MFFTPFPPFGTVVPIVNSNYLSMSQFSVILGHVWTVQGWIYIHFMWGLKLVRFLSEYHFSYTSIFRGEYFSIPLLDIFSLVVRGGGKNIVTFMEENGQLLSLWANLCWAGTSPTAGTSGTPGHCNERSNSSGEYFVLLILEDRLKLFEVISVGLIWRKTRSHLWS